MLEEPPQQEFEVLLTLDQSEIVPPFADPAPDASFLYWLYLEKNYNNFKALHRLSERKDQVFVPSLIAFHVIS